MMSADCAGLLTAPGDASGSAVTAEAIMAPKTPIVTFVSMFAPLVRVGSDQWA